ncbi:MAG: hypothetical protein AAGG09_19375 [Pseudomonadota bacterium]
MRRAGFVIALLAIVLSPIGAGATGGASLAMLAFTGVFFLANAVIRPGAVSLRDLAGTGLQIVTAAAFAALLVGLGQTLRALGRIEAEAGLEGWLVLAAWGVVLGRLIWRRSMGEKVAKGAETALRVVHRSGQRKPPAGEAADPPTAPTSKTAKPNLTVLEPGETPQRTAPPRRSAPAAPDDPALADALERMNALPEAGTNDAALSMALTTISGAAPLGAVFAALKTRAETCERDRRALALHSTDPWVAERRLGKGEPAEAFEVIVAAADPVALTDFASNAIALVDEVSAARHDMPAVPRLLEIADQIESALETEAELLVALAHKLEDLALDAEPNGDV